MASTPRLRSTYPASPIIPADGSPRSGSNKSQPKKSKDETAQSSVIPNQILDGPSQRLYVSLLYIFLLLWRAYDWSRLSPSSQDGFPLFTRWVATDLAFLYGLSLLRIPWLEWSPPTVTLIFIIHCIINYLLMFQIPLPIFSLLGSATKLLYDRELAISERRVKPDSIIRNSSLIQGKQIIHVLPEGFATINPESKPFCISRASPVALLPIAINETNPWKIEINHLDLANGLNSSIHLAAKEIKKLENHATKQGRPGTARHLRTWHYPVKRTGLYTLENVIDDSKLNVHINSSMARVLSCPSASIHGEKSHKCKGELSDFRVRINATAPANVKYSKRVNRVDQGHSMLRLGPSIEAPIEQSSRERPLKVESGPSSFSDQMHVEDITMNDSLNIVGDWQYMIDEVSDAYGNVINYSASQAKGSGIRFEQEPSTAQHFFVHERPSTSIRGCNIQNPLKAMEGKRAVIPLDIGSEGRNQFEEGPITIVYAFTSEESLASGADRPGYTKQVQTVLDSTAKGIEIREPGLYTLLSVSSSFCAGDILEPSSCLLVNPTKPDLDIVAQPIPDKCVGKSIGLLVNLNLQGTPPFDVHYNVLEPGGSIVPQMTQLAHLNGQLEFRPEREGRYVYEFTRVSDSVYRSPRSLTHKNLVLQHDIKPPPFADVPQADLFRSICKGQTTTVPIYFSGESPYNLEYETLHRGKRVRNSVENITENPHLLTLGRFSAGGEHVVSLLNLVDSHGCNSALHTEVKIEVRVARPSAAFGTINNNRNARFLQGGEIELPLRLQGRAPWTVRYRRNEDSSPNLIEIKLSGPNDHVAVRNPGSYELVEVTDRDCPGQVEVANAKFLVEWIPWPSVGIPESSVVTRENGRHFKKAVCQGDKDITELVLSGSPPFEYSYEQVLKPFSGSKSVSRKSFTAANGKASIDMETSDAGLYTYTLTGLSDLSYRDKRRTPEPFVLEQRVCARPNANFAEAGKIYKRCQASPASSETIPMVLEGQPPFYLEIEIRHQLSTGPERVKIANIESANYNLQLPGDILATGTSTITIYQINDDTGCERKFDGLSQLVQVSLADLPTIASSEDRDQVCVGDRIAFTLSGAPPFNIYYEFEDRARKAVEANTEFRRLAERPGELIITSVSDQRSTESCKKKVHLVKTIHQLPNVRISKGLTSTIDIHEGGEVEILLEFGGTPPFQFTYTRSKAPTDGQRAEILETKNDVSYDYTKKIRATAEGIYEVLSIRDRYCSFSIEERTPLKEPKLLSNR